MSSTSNLPEVIKGIMKEGTKQELLDVFMKVYKELNDKYKQGINDLQLKLENTIASKQTPKQSIDKNWKQLGNKIKMLEIELIYIKTWVPLNERFRGPCAYCEAFLAGKDDSQDYQWLKSGIMDDLNIDRKNYIFSELPVDWNWRGATAADNPIYKKLLLKEGMNLLYVNGLDIEGFPSLRIWVEFNDGSKLNEVVDGFGVPPKKEESNGTSRWVWNFNLREIIYSIIEQLKGQREIIEKSAHRRQDDGTPNDPVLFHQKPAYKKSK